MPKSKPQSTQERFLELCSDAAIEYGREPVVDYKFSNVGHFSVLREKGSLEVLFRFGFNFQSDERGAVASLTDLPGRDPKRTYNVETFTADRLPVALKRFRDELARILHMELEDELEARS